MALTSFVPPAKPQGTRHTVRICGDISRTVVAYTLGEFQRLLHRDSIEPITLEIHSGGGDVGAVNMLFHWIRAQEHPPIHGHVRGMCYSAAVLVLLACPLRACSARSKFFFHTPKQSDKDGMSDVGEFKKFVDNHVLALDCTRNDVLFHFARGDRRAEYISATAALRLGIVHQILSGEKAEE